MKRFFIFLIMSSFLNMYGAEQPKKRLLFPFSGETTDGLWQLMRQDWNAYHRAFEALPEGVNQLIAYFLLRLKNPRSFSTPEDQFFRRLLNCCVALSWKKKEWKHPFEDVMRKTSDGNYYTLSRKNLKIYDAHTNEQIISLPFSRDFHYELSLRRNVIFKSQYHYQGELGNCSLYDIAHNKWIDLGQWFKGKMSPTQKYIWGFDKKLIHIWNIADLNNIKHHTLEHNDQKNHFLKFNIDDAYVITGTRQGTLVFLEEKDATLTECFSYACDHPISAMEYNHHEGGDYLILYNKDKHRSLGMKMEKSEEGVISLKKSFDVPMRVHKLIGKNGLMFCDYLKTRVMDYSGNDCYKGGEEKTSSDCMMGKNHMCYQVGWGTFKEKRALIMTYPECDNENNFKEIKRMSMSGVVDDCPYSISSNAQETFWCTQLAHTYQSGCFDFHGKKILSFDHLFNCPGGMKFHSNGRALLYQNYENEKKHIQKGTIKKKYVLYPKGADVHLNSLAHTSLTIAQYCALEKVCGIIE